jgi:hypothetical protein
MFAEFVEPVLFPFFSQITQNDPLTTVTQEANAILFLFIVLRATVLQYADT